MQNIFKVDGEQIIHEVFESVGLPGREAEIQANKVIKSLQRPGLLELGSPDDIKKEAIERLNIYLSYR